MQEQRIRDFINKQRWIFSKTFARFAPHEYVVKYELPEADQELFVEFVLYIRKVGRAAYFGKKKFVYFLIDGHYYWTMGASIESTYILNRCEADKYELTETTMRYVGGRKSDLSRE